MSRGRNKKKIDPKLLTEEPRTSPTIERWTARFGGRPSFAGIARSIGVSTEAVSRVMLDEEPWEPTQTAIAKLAGVSVGDLFGDAAWFRQAGRALEARRTA